MLRNSRFTNTHSYSLGQKAGILNKQLRTNEEKSTKKLKFLEWHTQTRTEYPPKGAQKHPQAYESMHGSFETWQPHT